MRGRDRLAYGAFHRVPAVYYVIASALLALMAFAVVHELIPGLCEAPESGQDECAFCQLVHLPVIVALALALFCCALCGASHYRLESDRLRRGQPATAPSARAPPHPA